MFCVATTPRSQVPDNATGAVTPGWIEVRCSLFPRMDGPGQFVPWAALSRAVEQWRSEARHEQCFFVRKPPGLRLRFAGTDLSGRLEPVLLPWLIDAEQRNDLRGFRFVIYEPEEARFGGPIGVAIAHAAFDRDSRDAMQYEALPDAERASISPIDLSVAICTHLFEHSLGDRAEIWDVWQRLYRVIERHATTPTAARDASAPHPAPNLEALAPPVRALLVDRLDDNLRLARDIVAARDAGRLTVGLRSWLAAVTIFHWNRMFLSVSLDELATVVAGISRALQPDA
jgi:thiopeptide-type bacteriocin biosynthesis protein